MQPDWILGKSKSQESKKENFRPHPRSEVFFENVVKVLRQWIVYILEDLKSILQLERNQIVRIVTKFHTYDYNPWEASKETM